MAAGSIAKITGSAQGLPGTTFAVLDAGTIDTDPDNILTEVSAGRYRPDEEGYYFVTAAGRFDSTHNNRQNILWEFQRNSTDIAGTAGSGYSRNNANPYSYMRCGFILYFNGTSDYFELLHARDAGAGTPAGSYNNTRIKVVQLSEGDSDSLPYGRYGTPTAGAYTGTTPTAIAGWDVITENDTDVIELQAGGTAIRLKDPDRPYLLIYALQNDDAGAGRTTRLSDVTLDGTRVGHSGGYAYQRNSTCQNAVPFGMALMRPGSADLDVNVRCWGYDNTLAAVWGAYTFDDGSWSLSASAGDAGVMVIALPPGTNIAIYDDFTANQAVAGASDVTLNLFRTTIEEDAPFNQTGIADLDIEASGEFMVYGGAMIERIASSSTRNTSAFRIVQETTELTTATEFGGYLRGEQSGDDTKNMWLASLFMDTVTTGDTFQIEKFDPGTDDGANDNTSFGGSFAIDLSSLVVGSTETVAHTTDALLQATTAIEHDTHAILQDTLEVTHTSDALLESPPIEIDHTTDALLIEVIAQTHTADAVLTGKHGWVELDGTEDFVQGSYDSSFEISGDIDIRVGAKFDSLSATPEMLVGRWNGSDTDLQHITFFRPTSSSSLQVFIRLTNGNTTNQASDTGLAVTTPRHYRVTVDMNNGSGGKDFTFYYSDDPMDMPTDEIEWTLHSSHTISGTLGIRTTGSEGFTLGDRIDNPGEDLDGRIYWAEVYDGIAGTRVLNPDFRHALPGTDDEGITWTLQNDAAWSSVPLCHVTDALLSDVVVNTVDHDSDALLRATETVDHDTDSLLQKTLEVTHTSDSLLQVQVETTHNTDALLQSTVESTHTTEAVLRGTEISLHSTDALLQETLQLSHTTDAFLQAVFEVNHSTDAILRATVSTVHTTDAILLATQSLDHTTDALLQVALEVTHTTDAVLQAIQFVTHSTDAILQATIETTHTTDAVLILRISLTHTADALLVDRLTVEHTTDARLVELGTETHTSDALLQSTLQQSHTTDANLDALGQLTHTTDAIKVLSDVIEGWGIPI